MEKDFILVLQDDYEYYCLKIALTHYLHFDSFFECLDDQYVLCRLLLERIGAEYVISTENFFVLKLKDDNEWQCLKIALCGFLNFCSYFDCLKDEYFTCRSFLNRLGAEYV